MPFGVRSIGHYHLPSGTLEQSEKKPFFELFWGIAGKGEFQYRQKGFSLEPGMVFVYFPGDRHIIRTMTDVWEYRWLTLDGPLNTEVAKSFGFRREARPAGRCPEALFAEMERAAAEVTPSGERRASVLAFQVLTLACGGGAGGLNSLVERCRELIERDFANPLFSIKGMAAELATHRSSLCRLFTEKVGVSPHAYLASLRTRRAMELLKDSRMSVAEIARACGYLDPNYFSRALKKMTGMGPGAMRREFTP